MNAPTRPLLRYFGGKWLIAPWIIGYFNPHRIYVEPFGGGASVLLRKERSYSEVYNDLDGEIVNLFRVARDQREELRNKLLLTPFAREEYINAYNNSKDPVEMARKTIVKSFMGFGTESIKSKSGFRNISKGDSVPAKTWKEYLGSLDIILERLTGVIIENKDAVDVIKDHDSPQTLFYIDPPYLHSTRGRVRGYRHEMSDDEHIMLSECLHQVKGDVCLSGYNSDLYKELYKDWYLVEKTVFADRAQKRTECLWIKDYTEGLFR